MKAHAQDINTVGSKFDEEAHIAHSTSAAATLNVNKHKVLVHNATPMQYRVKEDVSDDKNFEGAQERFHCLRLDTKVDELDEAMNKIICKENKNKKITVHVELVGVRPVSRIDRHAPSII
ncbi:hypothetical protein C8R44DRAFT_748504 [Mycena epipterygia]|nr:hypothetical protein C8R44DRAFT_748504 [Mycena epipterygia]